MGLSAPKRVLVGGKENEIVFEESVAFGPEPEIIVESPVPAEVEIGVFSGIYVSVVD